MPRPDAATPAPGFLHDHPNFVDLLRQLAQQTGIATYLIEKDYWLMHGLWVLQQQGWQFQLKGGTSLSKGFGIIQRFSEDIDLRIEPPAEQQVKAGKNQDKPAHIETRRQYFDWLAAEIGTRALPGFESVERDTEYDDPKYRGAGIRLHYPVRTDYLPGIKEGILLEVGFDDTAPNTPCLISAWALDAALASPVQVIDNRAVDVPCYSPAYTFVEKLQTVSTKFRLQQAADPAAPFPKNFLRHYYDLYCLLAHPEVLAFIGTPDYEARKRQRFRGGDELNIARNPAFTLSDPTVRERYQRKYEETAGLYYAGQVPFAAILARIAEHIDRL
ncbi:MAG: nucleotidyl transferase AbiEii/AbiGii toxin family protein [Rhodocyclaceae bacterium]|nr:MAG: nucleotidyl transferase AbiEii/AbiGii toxin family protein [Rhodocyclaceae bacterium]